MEELESTDVIYGVYVLDGVLKDIPPNRYLYDMCSWVVHMDTSDMKSFTTLAVDIHPI